MNLIVAVDQHGIIAENGQIPWHIPEDLKRFRTLTLGHIVIMGRKTYESLPYPHGLPGRINVVITKNPSIYVSTEEIYFTNLEQLETLLSRIRGDRKVFVMGGTEIYKQLYDRCDTLYITMVYRKKENGEEENTYFNCDLEHFLMRQEYEMKSYQDLYFKYYIFVRKS